MSDFTASTLPATNILVSPHVKEHWEELQTELLRSYPHPAWSDMMEIRGLIDDFIMGTDCEHDMVLVHSGPHYTYQCRLCWHYKAEWIAKRLLDPDEVEQAQETQHHDYAVDQIYRLQIMQPFTELLEVNGEHDTASMDYYQYLSTPEWRAIRQRVLNRANYVCEGCGDRRANIVHHLTYERRGHEFQLDLIAVCKECHDLIHGRVT